MNHDLNVLLVKNQSPSIGKKSKPQVNGLTALVLTKKSSEQNP